MKSNQLFQVLVVGGALITLGGGFAGASPSESSAAFLGESVDAEELKPVFCDPKDPKLCEVDCSGNAKVKAGFECCWGTSCAN